MCTALFTLTPIWPHQSRFSNAQRTPLMTGSRGGAGRCPCTSCSHSSSSLRSSPCSVTRPSSGCSGDLLGIHKIYESPSLFWFSHAVQRCSKFDWGVSVRQQRHNTMSPFHFASGQGVVSQVSWAQLMGEMGDNLVKIFAVSPLLQTVTWTQDSRGRRRETRDTRLGVKVYKWPVWRTQKTLPSSVPVNNFGKFWF